MYNENFSREITIVKVTYHKKDKEYVAEVLENSKHIIKRHKIIHSIFISWRYSVIIEIKKDKYSKENLAIILSRLDYACENGKKVKYIKQ